jgi:putative membrane protein
VCGPNPRRIACCDLISELFVLAKFQAASIVSSVPPILTEKNTNLVVNVLSIAVPVVVALLLGVPFKLDLGSWTKVIPHVIGGINTITSLILVAGFIAQKAGKIKLHRLLMSSAIGLGALFLVCYVIYHLTNESTRFGGEGATRIVYYFVLFSHIALSLVVLPLVLRAFLFAFTNQIVRHKRIAKWAFPIWLYVSVTGVIAYLMISPYYAS